MHVLTQLSVPSNFEKPKRTVRLLGRIRYYVDTHISWSYMYVTISKMHLHVHVCLQECCVFTYLYLADTSVVYEILVTITNQMWTSWKRHALIRQADHVLTCLIFMMLRNDPNYFCYSVLLALPTAYLLLDFI